MSSSRHDAQHGSPHSEHFVRHSVHTDSSHIGHDVRQLRQMDVSQHRQPLMHSWQKFSPHSSHEYLSSSLMV